MTSAPETVANDATTNPEPASHGLNRVIAVVNGKGGVGKTTIATNVAALLASSGQRVLLVDMDSQGNATTVLGVASGSNDDGTPKDPRNDGGAALGSGLLFGTAALQIVEGVRDGLDLIVGGYHLEITTNSLAQQPERVKTALRDLLQGVVDYYDFVIIDCPPVSAPIMTTVIGAARWIIVPMSADQHAVDGLDTVAARIYEASAVNPDVEILGVVMNAIGISSRRVQRNLRSSIVEALGAPDDSIVFDSMPRHAQAAASDSIRLGLMFHELDSESSKRPAFWELLKGLKEEPVTDGGISGNTTGIRNDYFGLTSEIVQRITKAESEAHA